MSATFLTSVPTLAGFALLGCVLGGLHFAALDMQVRAWARGDGGVRTLLPLLRFALTAGGLILAARAGAGPLLMTAGGFLVARMAVLRLKARAL